MKFNIGSKEILLDRSQAANKLQAGIKQWWEKNPMTYDWFWNDVAYEEGTPEFYREIDKRFWKTAWFAHDVGAEPFSRLIDYPSIKGKRVLEIGCGAGALTAQLAKNGALVTAVDLTSHAVALTRRRFEVLGLSGDIRQMDAEHLEFPDETFDFVWSWGVIHASADTEGIMAHIHRVLKPGGETRLMVYHKNSIHYWLGYMLIRGVLFGGLVRHTPQELCDIYSDGLIAKVYTSNRFKEMLLKHFRTVDTEIYGQKEEIWQIPGSRFKDSLVNATPTFLARWLTERFGWFLFARAVK